MKGRLEVIAGPMFSGKTEELIRRLHRAQIAGKKVIAFKPSFENRYGERDVRAHSGAAFPCATIFFTTEISSLSKNYDVIGIDEAQFMNGGLRRAINQLLESGKTVILTGLDTTYRAEPWEFFPYFMAVSDKLDKLTAVCVVCGEDATRTQRLTDGKPASFDDATIVVGGKESYEARCRNCFQEG